MCFCGGFIPLLKSGFQGKPKGDQSFHILSHTQMFLEHCSFDCHRRGSCKPPVTTLTRQSLQVKHKFGYVSFGSIYSHSKSMFASGRVHTHTHTLLISHEGNCHSTFSSWNKQTLTAFSESRTFEVLSSTQVVLVNLGSGRQGGPHSLYKCHGKLWAEIASTFCDSSKPRSTDVATIGFLGLREIMRRVWFDVIIVLGK